MIFVALCGLVAAVVAVARSAPEAFLNVYLPVLLLMPDYYRWIMPALPDPTMGEAALLPIAAVFLARNLSSWKFSFTDVLVGGLAASMGYSELLNSGFADAQNLIFDALSTIVLPYMLAKGLIEPFHLRAAFARRFVFLLFAVALIGMYEFRFGATPWQLVLSRFFPGQGAGWVTTFRWGFARVAGPYGHAIIAGLIMAIGYRLQRWLEWSNLWEGRFRWPRLKWSKARVITAGLVAGVMMSMVRGPWIGSICGAVFCAIGRARDRKRAFRLFAAGIVLVAVPLAIAAYSYASVGRAAAKTASQETAAYRKELIDKYVAIALEKSMWGWGRNGWPKVSGMPSIDNYYLLLALMHGLVALGLFLTIIFSMVIRLSSRGMREPVPSRRGASLPFTLAGIYIAIAVTIATVFMGTQMTPIFAIITGWSEGYLLCATSQQILGSTPEKTEAVTPRHRYRRIVS